MDLRPINVLLAMVVAGAMAMILYDASQCYTDSCVRCVEDCLDAAP